MREYSTPLTIHIPATGNLTDDVVRNAREAADDVVFSRPAEGTWVDVTAARSSTRCAPSPRAWWRPGSSPVTGSP